MTVSSASAEHEHPHYHGRRSSKARCLFFATAPPELRRPGDAAASRDVSFAPATAAVREVCSPAASPPGELRVCRCHGEAWRCLPTANLAVVTSSRKDDFRSRLNVLSFLRHERDSAKLNSAIESDL